MLEALKDFIAKNDLIQPNQRILVATSGGRDSMVLLQLLHDAGYEIGAAHLNYHLRGEASNLDEKLVTETCKRLDIPLHVKHDDLSTSASNNIQIAARESRYEFFRSLIASEGYDLIATAHHADDKLETLFIQLMRGTGIYGLKGIAARTDLIVRPLLFASREEITNYASQQQIAYRDDESNASDKYLRNKVRHHLLPLIKELDETAVSKLFASTEMLEQDGTAMEAMANKLLNFSANSIHIKKKDLPTEHGEIWLYHAIRKFGFNRQQASDIYFAKDSSKSVSNGEYEVHAHVDKEWVVVPIRNEKTEPTLISKPGTYYFEHLEIEVSEMIIPEGESAFKHIGRTKNPVYFDADKIAWPLKFSPLKGSDCIVPLGMTQKVKIKKFTEDELLSEWKMKYRDFSVVGLVDALGEVIWLHELRVSEKTKVESSSKEVLRVETRPKP